MSCARSCCKPWRHTCGKAPSSWGLYSVPHSWERGRISEWNGAWNLKTVHLAIGGPGLCTWACLREANQVLELLVASRSWWTRRGRFRSLTYFTSEESNSKRDRVCHLRSPVLVTVSVPLGFRYASWGVPTLAFVTVKMEQHLWPYFVFFFLNRCFV